MNETAIKQQQADQAVKTIEQQPGSPEKASEAIVPFQSQYVQPGAKATNIIMQDHRVKQIEYYSESAVPPEVKKQFPIQSMMIDKRAIGFETELDILANDIEYDIIDLVYMIAGPEVAMPMALSYIHHREGLRSFKGAERKAQVTTIAYEESRSSLAGLAQQPGILSRAGRWLRRSSKPTGPNEVYGPVVQMTK